MWKDDNADEENLRDEVHSPVDSLIENEYTSPRVKRKQSVLSREVTGTEMIYNNIEYTLPIKENKRKFNKQILKGCTGIMKAGLNAILGPTGSGKTTLLDVLAARKDHRFIDGQVLVNRRVQSNDFRLVSGFVVQDDVVMGTLTVRENLMFSANLRLPKEFSSHDRKCRVDSIIEELGLTHVADTRLGTESRRGVSGGERKRTCIGMELVTSPDVLFLDEPTTGLDASTAVSVMKLLKKQGQKGRTIILSIHQPRYSIFKLFDNLTLMSDGVIVYNGPPAESVTFFADLGHVCETYNNPADYYMDVLFKEEAKQRKRAIKDNDDNGTLLNGDAAENKTYQPKERSLADSFKQTETYRRTAMEIAPVLETLHGVDEVDTEDTKQLVYQSNFLRQWRFVGKRAALNILRDSRGVMSQIFVSIFYGLLTGAIYWQLGTTYSGIQNRVGVFFFILTNQIFSNMSAVAIFLHERPIFRNECSNGYYRVSTYFMSKLLCDVIPMRVIPSIPFVCTVYFMAGLQIKVDRFFIFYLSVILTNLAGSSVCIFVSSSVELLAVANILCSIPFVIMMVFSGLLVNLTDVPPWLSWLQYISIMKYSMENLEINELRDLTFTNCGKNITSCTGLSYLELQGIEVDSLWWNELILGCFAVVLYVLAYVQLRRMKKNV